VVDVYLYIILSWPGYVDVQVPAPLQAWSAKIAALPFVQAAHAAMAAAKHA
jgi:hypothetical protein